MINGSGQIVSKVDEEGNDLPFLSTEEILKQIMKFGFNVTYVVRSNLPMNVINFLSTIDNLGYDKITKVSLESTTASGGRTVKPTVLVIKSEFNTDLLKFGCHLSKQSFNEKLAANTIMNVTHEPDMQWDWLNYIANISDLLDENIDPTDDFEAENGLETGSERVDLQHPPYDPTTMPFGFEEHHSEE